MRQSAEEEAEDSDDAYSTPEEGDPEDPRLPPSHLPPPPPPPPFPLPSLLSISISLPTLATMSPFPSSLSLLLLLLTLTLSSLPFSISARNNLLLLPSSTTTTSSSSSLGDPRVTPSSPLVGVVSQPGDGDGYAIWRQRAARQSGGAANLSYVAASYVKFVEAGGARAVPMLYNEREDRMLEKFRSINGLILPGGGAKKSGPFLARVKRLVELAMEANDNGDYFPIHAVCLGFEMLAMAVSGRGEDLLSNFTAQKPAPLHFVSEEAKGRSLFARMRPELRDKLETESIAMENHMFGITPETVKSDPRLSSFFDVLTTSRDEEGKEYVSTMVAKNYPFTAVQWHPEKNAFEWGLSAIPHSEDAIDLTHASASYLVSEARKSTHGPKSVDEENSLLIYNYNPYFSGKDGDGHFDQSYVFECSNEDDANCILDS